MRALIFITIFLVATYTAYAQPGNGVSDQSVRRCPLNARFRRCVPPCPPTCRTPSPVCRGAPCVNACYCNPGYIRRSTDGPCVRPYTCPR